MASLEIGQNSTNGLWNVKFTASYKKIALENKEQVLAHIKIEILRELEELIGGKNG